MTGTSPAKETARKDETVAKPSQFSWKDWKAILLRVKDAIGEDNVSLIAAGVAFYTMLAVFPAIAAFVSIYGMFADPTTTIDQIKSMSGFMPPEAYNIILDQTKSLIESSSQQLGFATVLALLLALWSARLGVLALITGLNIVYHEENQRGFFGQAAVSLALTAATLLVSMIAIIAIVVTPIVLDLLALGQLGEWIASVARWPIAVAAIILLLGLYYRFGPYRSKARLIWLSWGSVVATFLWAIGSAAFSYYVANFSNYNATYGSLGAVIGMLMWFYLSAFIVLLGAELNMEMERQTAKDTTVGPEKPMGERGAFAADTVVRKS